MTERSRDIALNNPTSLLPGISVNKPKRSFFLFSCILFLVIDMLVFMGIFVCGHRCLNA
jgi:hypothetical protein